MGKLALLLICSAVLLLAATACNSSVPQVTCPNAPAVADWGPVAPANGQSSVDIELNRL